MTHQRQEHSSEADAPTTPASRSRRAVARFLPVILVAAGVAGVVVMAKFLPKRNTDQAPTPPSPVPVTVLVVEPLAEVEDAFRIPGVVEANRVVDVAAEVAAQVQAYAGPEDTLGPSSQPVHGPASAGLLDEGANVKAGQPLVYLNTDLLLARRDSARAEYDFQTRELERIEHLREKGVATKMEMDQVVMRRDVAKAALELAEANLERTSIVAPISGVLNRLPAEIGEYVAPGTPVAQIVDVDKVKIVLDVPERDIGYLHVGDEETIQYGIDRPEEIRGNITYISELADPVARTTRIEITVDNPPDEKGKRRLRSGQIVEAKLRRRTLRDVIMISLESVIPLEKGYVAYVSEEGRARKRLLTLDPSLFFGQKIRVAKGLKTGDRLIVSRDSRIGPGQAVEEVEVRSATSAPASQPTSKPTENKSEENITTEDTEITEG
ncbi:MAG: efflux RND transporter periplasmic adaptor subunit [Phycisphaerae bacterium]|nr:efflux RND transporter periplasmic adaptor subunit [Phycisphaerae bacterium]